MSSTGYIALLQYLSYVINSALAKHIMIKRRSPAVRNKAPQGVRSWVVEFKRSRRPESLMSFDSLFKDALSQRAPAD